MSETSSVGSCGVGILEHRRDGWRYHTGVIADEDLEDLLERHSP